MVKRQGLSFAYCREESLQIVIMIDNTDGGFSCFHSLCMTRSGGAGRTIYSMRCKSAGQSACSRNLTVKFDNLSVIIQPSAISSSNKKRVSLFIRPTRNPSIYLIKNTDPVASFRSFLTYSSPFSVTLNSRPLHMASHPFSLCA